MAKVRALALGDAGPLPFCGHFRVEVVGGRATLAAAGRVASSAGLQEAYDVARRVEAVLRTSAEGAWWDTDRHGILRRAWTLLQEIPKARMGPASGTDLSVLFIAADERGLGVAGVGMDAVWAQLGGRWRALVPPGHPLLAPPGVPAAVPGVLTLDQEPSAVLGAPVGTEPTLPPPESLAARSGDRP